MHKKLRLFTCLKLLLIPIFAGWFLLFTQSKPAYAAWYNLSWGYRKQITIDADQVAGSSNLTNFPVLINLSSDASLSANAQIDGDDILFTASDETTKLYHEIESYNSDTGALVAWVNIPSLDYDDDTVIYMYYGNSGASNQESVENVWDSNYRMVHHFSETSGAHLDATSNNNDSTTVTVTTQGSASGKINGADALNGTNNFIEVSDSNSLDINSNWTVSSWIYLTSDTAGYKNIICKGHGICNYYMDVDPDEKVEILSEGLISACLSTNSVPLNTWTQVTGVFNNATDSLLIYLNGSLDNTCTGKTGTPLANNQPLDIGTYHDGGSRSEWWPGSLDEIRISATVRSTDWIGTEYNNQNSPSTFYTLGSAESGLSLSQSAYRWYDNDDSTDIGNALGVTNAPVSLSTTGNQFRLRMLIHAASASLGSGDRNFKLQYAIKAGTCDTSFLGETYADVTTTTSIAFYNNASPADGASVTTNANDPTHSGHTIVAQTYEEANNFTTTSAIAAGQDGLWDFALYDYSALGSESYCFRIVNSNGTLLDSYSVIPEIGIPVKLSFAIEGVGALTMNNGITTSATSTASTLPFGTIQVYTPKYIAHALTVSTNASSGYTVTMNLDPSTPNLQGLYPANIIDPFSATGASWSNPIAWSSPDGVVSNVNTGWFGANTSDTRVSGWSDGESKFGPVSSNPNIVMQSGGPDDSTIYVTYGLEVNINQPTDLYNGLIVYTITPTY